jgi:hypothetical protein
MKKYLLLLVLAFSFSHAQIKYDTLSSESLGKGIFYNKIAVPAVPWSIHVLKIDLKNPLLKIETVKAANLIKGNEPVSAMAKANSFARHNVFAAINGDFYHKGGIPTNIQIRNGQILTMPIPRTVIAFNAKNKPIINTVRYFGKVFKGNIAFSIDEINARGNNSRLVLYNRYYGERTAASTSGTEVLIKRISPWIVNDTVNCIVEKILVGTGNMIIPDTSYAVLSVEGVTENFLESSKVGDTLKILNTISPALPGITQAIGGFIQVINHGKDFVDQSYALENKPQHALLRHPRTAIGFSQDSTKLYLVAVDGRQKHSAGMTLYELADLLLKIGAYYGLNLDGGGSTTMVIKDSVVNSPSDGTERAVSNGLLFISTDPNDDLGQLYFRNKQDTVLDKSKTERPNQHPSK